jgi:peroxiredoxin
MAIEVGREAPDVTLVDEDGEPFRLRDACGRAAVLLVFHPFSFTGVCESEMCELAEDRSRYEQAGVEVVSVSCDAHHVRRAWKQTLGHGHTYASDFWPHGEASTAFGVFDEERGCARRATFLIDRAGVVRYALDNPVGERRDQRTYLEAAAGL